MSGITTNQVRDALVEHFESGFWNPSWDVIGDIVNDMHPADQDERYEAEQAAYAIWSQGRAVFDANHG